MKEFELSDILEQTQILPNEKEKPNYLLSILEGPYK